MRWGTLLVGLVVFGCERGGVRSVAGEVEITPRALSFDRSFVGHPTTRAVVLRNSARSDRRLSVAILGPFSAAAEVLVPGGAQLELAVQFNPIEEGPAAGTISLTDDANRIDVILSGQAIRVPACNPSEACLTSAFDLLAGACVEAPAADGAACLSDNACFVGGACVGGRCLGAARDCADTDRCSVDACDPTSGCVHLPLVCPVAVDPCKVASCDSVLGCVQSDAQDGTACGPADCSTAQVCIVGACKSLPVPDGAACGPITPCQGAGTCQQQSCQRPAPTALAEAWSYDFPGSIAGFRGVTDAAENLYWIECAFGGLAGDFCDACTMCAATSYTRNGVFRFRQRIIGMVSEELKPLHLIVGGRLIYVLRNRAGAVAIADGAPLWAVDFGPPLPSTPNVATSFEVTAVAADASGVYLLGSWSEGNVPGPRQSALVKLEASTGAVLYTRNFDGDLEGAVVDEQGNFYFGLLPRSPPNQSPLPVQLVSLSPNGVERWRVTPGGRPEPIAVYNGEVILTNAEVRSTLDGSKRVDPPAGRMTRTALMTANDRTLLIEAESPCCPTCACPMIIPRVDAVRLASGSPVLDWRAAVATSQYGIWAAVSDAVAARQGDTLVAGAATYQNATLLIALTPTGAQRFSCEVPPSGSPGNGNTSHFNSAVALLSGRWAVLEQIECNICLQNPPQRLRVFDVPGEQPASHGWVGLRGSPSGGSRPLP